MRYLLVMDQDIHGGSTVAVCPPGGIELDDGGTYIPSREQKWLWNQRVKLFEKIASLRDKLRPDHVVYGVNGDCVDGWHHPKSNSQYISPLESLHVRIAHACLVQSFDLIAPNSIHVTRGTGAHSGKAGTLEEGLFRVMLKDDGYPIVRDPDTGQVTSYVRRYELGGLLVDQRHHGRMGRRARTRNPQLIWYAQDIEEEHKRDGQRPPDLALRAHNHTYGDSGRPHRSITRVVSGGCWQLMTEYSYRGTFESLPSIGTYAIDIDDGYDRVYKFLAQPKRSTIVREP